MQVELQRVSVGAQGVLSLPQRHAAPQASEQVSVYHEVF